MASWFIPAAIGLASALFGSKKNPVQTPAPAPAIPQAPAAPPDPTRPRDISMPSVLQNPSLYVDPLTSQLGQIVGQNVAQGVGLSDQYRNALRGDAQAQLDLQRQRLQSQAAERMNAMGLLGSGALGVQSGMVDEEYMRNMLGLESTLAQQDIQEKARLQSLLQSLQQDSSARTQYLANLGLQHSGMQNQSDLNYQNLLSQHRLNARGQTMGYQQAGYQGQLAGYNAQNQAAMANASANQARSNAIFGNLMQLPYAYQANQMLGGLNLGQSQALGAPRSQSVGSNQRYQLPSLQYFGRY